MSIIIPRFLIGTVGWNVRPYSLGKETAGICLWK